MRKSKAEINAGGRSQAVLALWSNHVAFPCILHLQPNNFYASLSFSIRPAPLCGIVSMRWCLSFLSFCFLGVVHALSSSGSRLLVVLEEAAQKDLYSTFWSDLEGTWFHWTTMAILC